MSCIFLLSQLAAWTMGSTSARSLLPLAVMHTLFSFVWNWGAAQRWFRFDVRLLTAVTVDNILMAYGMMVAPEGFLVIIWVPLFTTLGYGLRYGKKWVYATQVSDVLTFGTAILCSAYWRENYSLACGFMASMLIVPQYAMQLSKVIANERAAAQVRVAELERSSRVDALTSAFNRSGIEHELAMCLSRNIDGALLYVDLDGFKSVNDTAGHQAGDRVLQETVGAMRRTLRSTDHVGRLGGDEFALVLPGASPADAQFVANKLLMAVRSVSVPEAGNLRVGASIGVCMFPGSTPLSAAEVLERADQRMYAAKRAGKDRVVCADVTAEAPAAC